MLVGITEANDAALCEDWVKWVEKGEPTILITKNAPLLLQNHPDLIFKKNVIVHVTCTGLGSTVFEPNVPKPEVVLSWLEKRSPEFRKRLVLRCDPICPPYFTYSNDLFNGKDYYDNVMKILKTAKDLNMRIRISFLDMYPHVRHRIFERGLTISEAYTDLHLKLDYRQKCLDLFNEMCPQDYEICGEPGMSCSGCVSLKDLRTFFGDDFKVPEMPVGVQRQGCACLAMKKELCKTKGPCSHGCLYCYWK